MVKTGNAFSARVQQNASELSTLGLFGVAFPLRDPLASARCWPVCTPVSAEVMRVLGSYDLETQQLVKPNLQQRKSERFSCTVSRFGLIISNFWELESLHVLAYTRVMSTVSYIDDHLRSLWICFISVDQIWKGWSKETSDRSVALQIRFFAVMSLVRFLYIPRFWYSIDSIPRR